MEGRNGNESGMWRVEVDIEGGMWGLRWILKVVEG